MFELDEVYGLGLELNTLVTGVDEVGRGPIAGPVNACAASCSLSDLQDLAPLLIDIGVMDSKKLSSKKRLAILELLEIDINDLKIDHCYQREIKGKAFSFCLGEKTHEEIDQMNILNAALGAMADACEKSILAFKQYNASHIFIDGNKLFCKKESWTNWPILRDSSMQTVVKGDSRSLIIALASIIAKEYRDAFMGKQECLYPGYGLSQHAGYPTASHKKAVQELGPSAIHRKTFKGVREHIQ